MFSTSTHKSEWIMENEDVLLARRKKANESFREKFASVLQPGEEGAYLTIDDEQTMLSIVQESALKFGDDFKPPLYPSVRYTAFAYFKRFFIKFSAMEYSPKTIMTACYYLATKVDEFYVTIEEFVANLKSGTPERNTQLIIALEPEIMRSLNYSLVVHTPYRPLEGHFLDMKQKLPLLNFDVESLRPAATDFLTKSLLTDCLLLYSPSQIALASLKYALKVQDRAIELMTEFLQRIFGIEESQWGRNEKENVKIELLNKRLDAIISLVDDLAVVPAENRQMCMKRCTDFNSLLPILEERKRLNSVPQPQKEDNFDSDDEFG